MDRKEYTFNTLNKFIKDALRGFESNAQFDVDDDGIAIAYYDNILDFDIDALREFLINYNTSQAYYRLEIDLSFGNGINFVCDCFTFQLNKD